MFTEIIPYLQYSEDQRQVRCTICYGRSGAGLGRHGIELRSLKTHLTCNAHKTCWRSHLEREAARTADLKEFSEVSNAAAMSAFPDFEDITPSHPPSMFTEPQTEPDFPAYQRVYGTAELIQELGEVEESAAPTVADKQSNLRQQYEQMLLDAYQADHLENEDGVDDQFVGDEMPKHPDRVEDEDEDEQCFDPSALSPSAYHPYPSKAVSRSLQA